MRKLHSFFLLLLATILFLIASPFVFIYNTIRLWKTDYWLQVAIGIDQLGGSLLYNEQDYTISSYTFYLCRFYKKFCWFEKFINFFFGKGHCERSFRDEQKEIIEEARL